MRITISGAKAQDFTALVIIANLYPINLKNRIFDFEKAPWLDDRKRPHIVTILGLLRSSNHGNFLFAKN